MVKKWLVFSIFSGLLLAEPARAEFELSGYVGAEWREYLQQGQYEQPGKQASRQISLAVEPEMVWVPGDGKHTVSLKPYARIDSADHERTHSDIRELSWLTYGESWELLAGISKVYWGVTESQHLVDIINQTDFVEAPDGEDKLGQPMVRLSLIRDWGTVNMFALTGFRERTFPGEKGRFRRSVIIDSKHARYQSGDKEKHLDYAVRWSHTLGSYDVGLSWFQGTSRDPLLSPAIKNNISSPALAPFYPLIRQSGVDVQATLETVLLKFEAVYRNYDTSVKKQFKGQKLQDYAAATAGFEYTFYELFDDPWELGLLMEYQYDTRKDKARASGQNDLFSGGRLAFNDAASSELLMGISQDLDDTSTRTLVAEGSTRLGSAIKLNLDVWLFQSDEQGNLAYAFRQDDFVQLGINYYF